MRRFLALGAAALLPLVVAGGAGGSGTQFAVGSAKTEVNVFIGLEHASFSAHSTGVGCEAKGQIVYDNAAFGNFTAKIETLVIQPTTTGGLMYLAGRVTRFAERPEFVGLGVSFVGSDSGLGGSDGKGDTFVFNGLRPPGDIPLCGFPLTGNPITSGNIVIKATGPMLLP